MRMENEYAQLIRVITLKQNALGIRNNFSVFGSAVLVKKDFYFFQETYS